MKFRYTGWPFWFEVLKAVAIIVALACLMQGFVYFWNI